MVQDIRFICPGKLIATAYDVKPGRKRRLFGCPFKPLFDGRTDLLPAFVKPRALRF